MEWYNSDDIDMQSNETTSDVLELRDWQRKAKKFFYENDCKSIFEIATGSGKTYISIDIINEIINKEPKTRVLIVVPKNVILETGWYKELVDFGIPIQKIGIYYGKIKEYAQITLTNMQSVKKIPLELFDFIILDEIHNYASERLLEVVKYPFKYKLGLTATLKRLDNRHVHLLKAFNYNIFKYNAREALYDSVLNPFIFYNIGVEMDSASFETYKTLTHELNTFYRTYGNYGKIMSTGGPIKNKMLALMNERKQLVNNYATKFNVAFEIIKKHKQNKIIVFNQFNDQTSKLYWYLLEDDIDCRVVHSGISNSKREQALIDFKKDKYNVLLASKVLDEGYNLPKLDMAIIMAGDSSEKQPVQRMGRVLRKKEGIDSILIQIYCKGTFEERDSNMRAKLFKGLASSYTDIDYVDGDEINLV